MQAPAGAALETATTTIVDALTRAIAGHRLQAGAKRAELKLADHRPG
jgi:DNA-binding GntR family transcriptional regulator